MNNNNRSSSSLSSIEVHIICPDKWLSHVQTAYESKNIRAYVYPISECSDTQKYTNIPTDIILLEEYGEGIIHENFIRRGTHVYMLTAFHFLRLRPYITANGYLLLADITSQMKDTLGVRDGKKTSL